MTPASNDSFNLQKELHALASLPSHGASFGQEYDAFLSGRAPPGPVHDARIGARRRHPEFASASDLLGHIWQTPGGLHPGFLSGVIAPGALANLAVWDASHPSMWPGSLPLRSLAMGDTAGALWGMMGRGRWIGQPGDFAQSVVTSSSYRRALEDAQARFKALCARL